MQGVSSRPDFQALTTAAVLVNIPDLVNAKFFTPAPQTSMWLWCRSAEAAARLVEHLDLPNAVPISQNPAPSHHFPTLVFLHGSHFAAEPQKTMGDSWKCVS